MSKPTIKKAKKEDIKQIVEIHKECVSKTNAKSYNAEIIQSWLQQINERNVLSQFDYTSWLVIKQNNKIIGFAQYDLEEQTLYQIQIHPNYQGKGYGKMIFKYIENDFIKNKRDKVLLNSTLNAMSFYTSLGFRPLKKILFDNIELITMEKNINK